MAGATQNNAYASNVALAARSAVSKVASGTPAFILVCAGDGGHSKDPATIVKGAVDNLNGNPQGRNYYFLRPQDLAATWKVWKGYSAATSTP